LQLIDYEFFFNLKKKKEHTIYRMGEEKTRGFEWPDYIHPTYREKNVKRCEGG